MLSGYRGGLEGLEGSLDGTPVDNFGGPCTFSMRKRFISMCRYIDSKCFWFDLS